MAERLDSLGDHGPLVGLNLDMAIGKLTASSVGYK